MQLLVTNSGAQILSALLHTPVAQDPVVQMLIDASCDLDDQWLVCPCCGGRERDAGKQSGW